MKPAKAAWETHASAVPSSPRSRRVNRKTLGNLDKESMVDKMLELQRQLNIVEDDKTKLQTETVRLELELSKVLRENEELFQAKSGSVAITGASANFVRKMKKTIKELEGKVSGKDLELKKIKGDARVTRMAELEVERNTFLREVKRLQRDLALARQQIEKPPAPRVIAGGGGEDDEGIRKVYALYEALSKDHEGLKRKVRGQQVDAAQSAEERKQLAGENEKLKLALQAARQKASRLAAADKSSKIEGEAKAREEELTRQVMSPQIPNP